MIDLGTVRPGSTIRIPFTSFDKDDGSSITMTNFAVGDILIYKDGNTTERASTTGYTATTDFDGKTGKHLAIIDLSSNATADFFNAGSEYLVAIDAVTIDGVTTGGWIARFKIGYRAAILDTTIATLSSQTSFTLTSGPAEDDALNGFYAVIHDIASAVQLTKVLILDYTGSTKTVTLVAGGTFTVAAGDNISVVDLAPLQPTTLGATLDVAATGEAGVDWGNVANKTTANALTNTSIITTQKVDVDTIKTNPVVNGGTITFPSGATLASTTNITAGTITTASNLTTNNDKTGYGLSSAAVQAIWDALTSALTTVGSIGKRIVDFLTGDVYGRLGAPAGASVSADIAAVKSDSGAIKTKTDSLTFTVASQVDANVIDWKGATAPAMTGDAFARLGAPAGASVSADVAAVKTDTAAIKLQTDNLPSDPADESLIIAATDAIMARLGAPVGASISADISAILGGLIRKVGTVADDVGNSASTFLTDFTEADDDFWKDSFLTFIDGAMAGQTKKITGYDGTTKFVTTDAFTAEPTDGDTFLIVNV